MMKDAGCEKKRESVSMSVEEIHDKAVGLMEEIRNFVSLPPPEKIKDCPKPTTDTLTEILDILTETASALEDAHKLFQRIINRIV